MFDRNSDGIISSDDLCSVMRSLGENASESEVQEMIYEIDLDGKGAINFEEFVVMMARKSQTDDDEEDIKETFSVFDKNRDGFVTAREISEILSKFECPLPMNEIEDMIKSVDLDGDGMLSFEEFSNLLKSTDALNFGEVAHNSRVNIAKK